MTNQTALSTEPFEVASDTQLHTTKKERNIGIELFRITSMLLIVLLHVLGQGGILGRCVKLSTNYKIAWYLETLGYCSVNCYALISGYVNVKSNFKFRRIVYLWLEVFTIATSTTILCKLLAPNPAIGKEEWLLALLPLTFKEYWYFNAYFLLFFFIPILNKGMLALKKHEHLTIMCSLFVFTTLLRLVRGSDLFVLGSGYSCMWLIVLYVFGAYFKLYGFPKFAKWYVTLPTFFAVGGIAWGWKILIETLIKEGKVVPNSQLAKSAGRLISYVSPCMVIMAIALMAFFSLK